MKHRILLLVGIILMGCKADRSQAPQKGGDGGEHKQNNGDEKGTADNRPGEKGEAFSARQPPPPWYLEVSAAALSPDGKLALLGYKPTWKNSRYYLKLWDAAKGKELKNLVGHTGNLWLRPGPATDP
jgi:hypothetical protein